MRDRATDAFDDCDRWTDGSKLRCIVVGAECGVGCPADCLHKQRREPPGALSGGGTFFFLSVSHTFMP